MPGDEIVRVNEEDSLLFAPNSLPRHIDATIFKWSWQSICGVVGVALTLINVVRQRDIVSAVLFGAMVLIAALAATYAALRREGRGRRQDRVLFENRHSETKRLAKENGILNAAIAEKEIEWERVRLIAIDQVETLQEEVRVLRAEVASITAFALHLNFQNGVDLNLSVENTLGRRCLMIFDVQGEVRCDMIPNPDAQGRGVPNPTFATGNFLKARVINEGNATLNSIRLCLTLTSQGVKEDAVPLRLTSIIEIDYLPPGKDDAHYFYITNFTDHYFALLPEISALAKRNSVEVSATVEPHTNQLILPSGQTQNFW